MAETAKILYKKGSKGDEVTNIQTALGDYYTSLGGTPDADYGNKTHDAVFKWQEDWNNDPAHETDQIKVDGIVGEETYPRLMQWYQKKQDDAAWNGVDIVPPQGTVVPAPTNNQPAPVVPGTNVGETVSEYAAAKAAANSGTPNANIPSGESQVTDKTKQTTQDSGQAQVVTTPSNHLADWGKQSFADVMKGSGKDVPIGKLIQDHLQWCQENGVMPDLWTINSVVNKAEDMTLSAEDNEKARKRAENKARWDKVGNFLLHLGNAIGNVGGGGYASMKIEDPIQFTERQRQLKEKADQIRKANNQSIFQQMQKGWAEQRAAEIQKNALARQQKQDELAQKRLDNESKKLDAYIQATKQKTADNTRLTDSKIDLNDKTGKARMITANKPRAGRSNPYKETITERTVKDANGNVQKEIATRSSTRPYSGRNQGRGQGRGLKKLPTAKK